MILIFAKKKINAKFFESSTYQRHILIFFARYLEIEIDVEKSITGIRFDLMNTQSFEDIPKFKVSVIFKYKDLKTDPYIFKLSSISNFRLVKHRVFKEIRLEYQNSRFTFCNVKIDSDDKIDVKFKLATL